MSLSIPTDYKDGLFLKVDLLLFLYIVSTVRIIFEICLTFLFFFFMNRSKIGTI